MAKTRKPARARTRSAAKTAAKRKRVKRAAAGKPARKPARRRAAKRKAPAPGLGARIAHAVEAVLGTLSEAERLQTQAARKGIQELE